MKPLFTLSILVLISFSIFGQAPHKMSYQCVVRNASGDLVINQGIGIRISILQGSATGNIVYQETYNPNPQTNGNGLLSIEIGSGLVISGIFSDISWANRTYFLKTETDPTGGTNYTVTGITQLLSVPYALHSKSAETAETTAGTFNLTGDQIINGNKTFTGVTTVQTPANATDAATKAYVDVLLGKIEHLESLVGVEKPVTDFDGNTYLTIRIGTQVWMTENLKVTHYLNGDPLPGVSDNTTWGNLTTGAYCDYNNSPNYSIIYGRLYNWYSVVDIRNLCPTGWHIPSYPEWTTLFTYLGGGIVADGALRETGTTHWASPNSNATNESGFTALPGGARDEDGTFFDIGNIAE